MATVLIDKLLQAAIKQGASDIHIVVGQPPVFRLHGRMRKLETKVLEAEDSVGLMKSITPERCQRELQNQVVPTLDLRLVTRPASGCLCSNSVASSRWFCVRFLTTN